MMLSNMTTKSIGKRGTKPDTQRDVIVPPSTIVSHLKFQIMVKGNAIPSSEGGDKKSVVGTPKYPIYDNGKLHISISQGNSKMGNIPQFNILPGDEPLTG